MCKVTNKQIVKAFKLAKKELSNNGHYICHALEDIQGTGKITGQVTEHCKRIILDRISPFYAAGSWMKANGISEDKYGIAWRSAWLDKLVEEFSNE